MAERKVGGAPNTFLFTKEDFLGPAMKDFQSEAIDELKAQIGLAKIKESVDTLLQVLATNTEREEQELPLQEVALNRLFVGNPGTGKTTVAKLYGRILKELGLLSKGELHVKNPSDFVGAALGESEKKTKSILANSLGCVLLIDEA